MYKFPTVSVDLGCYRRTSNSFSKAELAIGRNSNTALYLRKRNFANVANILDTNIWIIIQFN